MNTSFPNGLIENIQSGPLFVRRTNPFTRSQRIRVSILLPLVNEFGVVDRPFRNCRMNEACQTNRHKILQTAYDPISLNPKWCVEPFQEDSSDEMSSKQKPWSIPGLCRHRKVIECDGVVRVADDAFPRSCRYPRNRYRLRSVTPVEDHKDMGMIPMELRLPERCRAMPVHLLTLLWRSAGGWPSGMLRCSELTISTT